MTPQTPEKAARAPAAPAAAMLPVTSRKRTPRARSRPPTRFVDPAILPPEYALIAQGTCMLPDIPDGAHCAFTTIGEPRPGDLVALWFRPEIVPAGEHQVRIKRLVYAALPFVRLPYREHPDGRLHPLVIVEMINPRRQFGISCGYLLAIHRFIGLAELTRPGLVVRLRCTAGHGAGCTVVRPALAGLRANATAITGTASIRKKCIHGFGRCAI
jgi:hypothetical protein